MNRQRCPKFLTLGTGLGPLQGPNESIIPRRNVHTGARQGRD